ncbi:MAG: hypothetical protein HYX52_08425 [Chloroflexi bacterium]|nr:hypothetical protein [Chloroflexota bacterium]
MPPPMDKPELARLTDAMLEAYTFPGTDAAWLLVPDDGAVAPQVQEILDHVPSRWYPTGGGHRVKVPWWAVRGRENYFQRETKGWDHEHCDYCEAAVKIGEQCWTIPAGQGVWIICAACRDQMPKGGA